MSQIIVRQSADGSELNVVVSGTINEETVFPNLEKYKVKTINLDLKTLENINSLGIRDWVNWLEPLSLKFEINILNCSKRLIHQFNVVTGFLPTNARITSFYVPFFCEKCEFEDDFLFQLGSEVVVKNGQVHVVADLNKFKSCEDTGCGLELDGSPIKYFKFIKST